jgi:general secretion pathway protein M
MARLGFRERMGRLTPRERRLATILGGFFALVVFVGLPGGLEAAVVSRRSEVTDLRGALDAVRNARAQIRERQSKKDSIALRYAKKAPVLAGFIEELARAQKLEVTESQDRPEVPHGKKFSERSTTVRLKRSGMLPIAKFLESVETSGYPVIVSRLDLRKRAGEPDSYDAEVAISAYDRVVAEHTDKSDKGDKGDKSETATPASSAGGHTSP